MPTLPKLNSVRVPSDGPDNADIMVVGEAPGKEEEEQGRPFAPREQGRMNAGTLISRYFLDRLGVRRSDVYYTNLGKYRPHGNDFKHYIGTQQLEQGLQELKEDIERVNPNVIIAAGAWPLYYLTGECGTDKAGRKTKPGTGILSWRGSVIPCSLVPGKKVVALLHPAYIIRSWGWHPIFLNDLRKAVENSKFPEIRYPQYESIIDPPMDELDSLVGEMSKADWLSVDIETFPNNTCSCIGFSDRVDRGLCLTFKNKGWKDAAEDLLSSSARKIFQYGTFDTNFLKRFPRLETNNWAFDTYIAAASLTPEFPRGLDFLTSIYTDFPYYKTERKTWKLTGDMTKLWEYNIKDIIATLTIAHEQMKELTELFGGPVWEKWRLS